MSTGRLQIVDDSLVFTASSNDDNDNVVVVDGRSKRCLAFSTLAGGLIALLRDGSDSIADEAKGKKNGGRSRDRKSGGGRTASGIPVSHDGKRTLSICSFDLTTKSFHFSTHVSVDGWSHLVCSPDSPFVVLTDYNTAHSEVLEWLPPSKTLRRVWEGKGSCPHHFNNGEDILLLLYSARKFSLCKGRTMKEIGECSARSRELDIVDVLACEDHALVVYENGACSVFSVSEDDVRRVLDLGKILNGQKPAGFALVDDTGALIIYGEEEDDTTADGDDVADDAKKRVVCFLNPMTVGNKNTFEKSVEPRSLFRSTIAEAEAAKRRQSDEGNARNNSSSSASKTTKKDKKKKNTEEHDDSAKVATSAAGNTRADSASTNPPHTGTGISLGFLVAIAIASMAVTAAVVVKVAAK